jgi:hypothetical protein
MNDFEIYLGKSENGLVYGDLMHDPATDDISTDDDELSVVSAALYELFDMTPADDLSHPEIWSNQRAAYESEGTIAETERKLDALRLLKSIPEINPDSIYITIENAIMNVEFRTISGSAGRITV